MINYITYAGKSLRDFNLYVNGRGTYDAPAKVYTMVEIPGRSGDLAYDEKRFKNIDVTYPAAFINPGFEDNFYDLRAFLYSFSGYQRLEDTYHPDEFRMAIYKDGLNVKNMDMLNMFGTFDLVFHCKPQRFLKIGETSVYFSSSGTINNPTNYESKPLIKVTVSSSSTDRTFGIGSETITVSNPIGASVFYIDCESMDAYYLTSGTPSARYPINNKVTFSSYNFPVLKPGDNGVSWDSGIASIEITPRWWTV